MIKKATERTEAQKQYAAKKEQLVEMQRVANKASMDAIREWKAKNPDCSDLALRPMNIAYVRRKVPMTKAILAVAMRMTYPLSKDKTQAELVREVQAEFPDTPLYASLWQRELSSGLLARINTIINGNLPKPISLKGCKSLSDIRAKVKASQRIAKGKWSCKVEITITSESVTIGKETYLLEKRTSGYGIRVPSADGKRHLVRMEGLAAALKRAQ